MDAGEPTIEPLIEAEGVRPNRRRVLFRRIAYVVGVVMLVAAVWAAVRGLDGRGIGEVLSRAPLWLLAIALVMPGLNWLLTTTVFWRLTSRYGRVPFAEMYALLGTAWLLNHLPMRPGLIGRIAYHKAVHGIALRHSSVVLVQALACAGIAAAVLLTQLLASRWGAGGAVNDSLLTTPLLLVSGALCGAWIAVRIWSARRSANSQRCRTMSAILDATALRYADAVVWAARYAVAFAIAGEPLGVAGAVAVALASQLAMLMPVQLGVREWVVGLTAASLPGSWFASCAASSDAETIVAASGQAATTLTAIAPGLLADLIGRAAELAWAIPGGLVCGWWLATRRKNKTAESHGIRAESGENNEQP